MFNQIPLHLKVLRVVMLAVGGAQSLGSLLSR